MMHCGLLGRKLGHSYSPRIHACLGSYRYTLIEREPEALDEFFADPAYDAFNVTIPYKEEALARCDMVDEAARKIGSVNTVVRREGRLWGYNTDYDGFDALLTELSGPSLKGAKVLVLGSGGSSKTVCAVVRDRGGNPVVISRTGAPGCRYDDIGRHYADTAVIVNTTPVGMYPSPPAAPLSLEGFCGLQAVIDLIYNPARTALLLDAAARGIPCANGLLMLVTQAAKASALFRTADSASAEDSAAAEDGFFRESLSESERATAIRGRIACEERNLILVGMPGAGKTTVGRLCAEALGREFFDADEEVTRQQGRSPADIITSEGEDAFRRIESEVLAGLCLRRHAVIACGGGAVLLPGNRTLLRQNALVIWLRRSPDQLALEGRPLSARCGIEALYAAREPLYREVCDLTVDNDTLPEEAARAIVRAAEMPWPVCMTACMK